MPSHDRLSANTDDALVQTAVQAPTAVSRQIEALFERGTSDWNAGDLPGFLQCYENAPGTSYLSGAQIVMGYDAIEQLFATRLGERGAAAMGSLRMSLLRVVSIGPEHAHAIGRFQLTRDDVHGESQRGIFSVVLRHTALGWRIVADHTSS
jgi:ketosteroid isomerase-like protein